MGKKKSEFKSKPLHRTLYSRASSTRIGNITASAQFTSKTISSMKVTWRTTRNMATVYCIMRMTNRNFMKGFGNMIQSQGMGRCLTRMVPLATRACGNLIKNKKVS